MKLRHFETLKPICPFCLSNSSKESLLSLRTVNRETKGDVFEGVLVCSDKGCQSEYPIIDGIPIILPDLKSYISQFIFPIMMRNDLGETVESLLGDCCGPGAALDVHRQHLSSYVHGHYGDLDPLEDKQDDAIPGGIATLFRTGMELIGEIPQGPMIDIGCSAGRSTFALAEQRNDLVLGVDLNFSMLKTALDVLNTGSISYPRRRVGMVFDRREFCVNFKNRDCVDFWVCDALALPFSSRSFSLASSLNLIDCVSSPHAHLESIERILLDNGKVMIASPYDWSSSATSVESWIGGHSQRSDNQGRSEAHIKDLFKDGNNPARINGLKLIAEKDSEPWTVRLHERSVMKYQVHLLAAEKESS